MFPQQSVKLKGRQNLMQIIESQQLNKFLFNLDFRRN